MTRIDTMTELEQTQFQRYPELRQKFSKHLKQMPEPEKEKLDYIWICTVEGKAYPQFLENGKELKFSAVKEDAEESEHGIEAVYFVPIDEELPVYGVESKEKDLDVKRRGYPQVRTNWLKDLDSINDALYNAANNQEQEEFKHRIRSLIHNDGEMKVLEELHRYCYLIQADDKVAFISDHGEIEFEEDWNYDMKTYKNEDSEEWKELSDYQ